MNALVALLCAIVSMALGSPTYLDSEEAVRLESVLDSLYGDGYEGERFTAANATAGDCRTEMGQLFGILCNVPPYTHVTHISLPSKGLKGTIPSEIEMLTELRSLNLFNNELSGSLPTQLGQMATAEKNMYLVLYGNKFQTIVNAFQ